MKEKPRIAMYCRVGTKEQLEPDIEDLLKKQKIEELNCLKPQKIIDKLTYLNQNVEKRRLI